MANFKVNINAEDVINQMENANTKPQSEFDPKRYLNTKLPKDEQSKTLTVRLLPFSPEGGSCFHKVHMHNIQVNKEVAPSGWKMMPCPKRNGFADECALCKAANEAAERAKNATTEEMKSSYMDFAKAHFARNMWVARCIERGHEDDGVKFWLFNDRTDGQGVKDKILHIFNTRREKIGKDGQPTNIFDVNNGKDLIITITRDALGKQVINITDDDEKSPLTEDEALGYSWINDDKKWDDMYRVKPYEYMEILCRGGIPYFDKKNGKYVDKETYLAQLKSNKTEMDMQTSKPSKDYSKVEEVASTVATEPSMPSISSSSMDDDELPF